MAHEFESGFFYKDPAWHGLGQVLDHVATAEEALIASSLNWTVKKQNIYLEDHTRILRNYATVRESDNKILGVVGENYEPLQNCEAFKFFDNVVSKSAAIYHAAGSLKEGKIVWILAKLPSFITVKNDCIDKYVLLSTSHDGTKSTLAGFTPTRVVCMNTLSYALKGLSNRISIRHTKNAKLAFEQARNLMGIANKTFDKISEIFTSMSDKQLVPAEFKTNLDKVFPISMEYGTRSENIQSVVTGLFEGEAKGYDVPGFRGTVYGAYNSVVEYVDYRRKSKDRLNTVWFGSGNTIKEKAFEEATLLL